MLTTRSIIAYTILFLFCLGVSLVAWYVLRNDRK